MQNPPVVMQILLVSFIIRISTKLRKKLREKEKRRKRWGEREPRKKRTEETLLEDFSPSSLETHDGNGS